MKGKITIKEARKILGKKYLRYSDDEIQRVVNDIHALADITLDVYLDLKSRGKLPKIESGEVVE